MSFSRLIKKIDRHFHPSYIYALQPDHELLIENRKLLSSKDILLLSYPRSGNTWLRRLLANSILEAQHNFSDVPFEIVVPSIYTQSLNPPCLHAYQDICPRIVKSHEHRDAKRHKTIYLLRNPVDTLVSWYHFVTGAPKLRNRYPSIEELSIDKFCLNAVEGWAKHVQITRRYKNILVMEYEQLFQDTTKTLKDILEFCEIDHHAIDLGKIVDNQSIRQLKPITQSLELRKGGIGHGQRELQPETVTALRQYQQWLNTTWKAEMGLCPSALS